MRLGVNIDHVATVREARKGHDPEPVAAAVLAELAGADGITVHLRGDRRHMQERDVELLRAVVSTRLNVEMAATPEMVDIAIGVKPHQVTLVPERPNELTTTGGLDVVRRAASLKKTVGRLQRAGIAVSVFVDPDRPQVKQAAAIGATAVEINTGTYAEAMPGERSKQLRRVARSASVASRLGLEVLAGHGLTYANVEPIVEVDEIVELNIGHSIVARAVLVGLECAVCDMLDLLHR